ncbi:MAG: hypothetical protein IT196_27205 [Acidimicrobiales bacterium]|nr:hypothetical protein [Acidimicrobiales bacterium]
MIEPDDEQPAVALGCRAWLCGTGRGFPRRLQAGSLLVDGRGLVWRSLRRWYTPVALDPSLVALVAARRPGGLERVLVRAGASCTVFDLRYLTLDVQLAVADADTGMVRAALRRTPTTPTAPG